MYRMTPTGWTGATVDELPDVTTKRPAPGSILAAATARTTSSIPSLDSPSIESSRFDPPGEHPTAPHLEPRVGRLRPCRSQDPLNNRLGHVTADLVVE